jgi:hypothetical protein
MGNSMTLPNFLVIGVTKAGTTSIHHYLRQHPDIYLPSVKEPRFLGFDPEHPDSLAKFPIRSLTEYERLFAGAERERAIGEASPQYFHNERALANIHSLLDDPRMIISFRNPVERAYSGYLMGLREGTWKTSFASFVKENPNRMARGRYAPHLRRYLNVFPRKQFLFIKFEDFRQNPANAMKDMFSFLNVDASYRPDVSVIKNKGGVPRLGVIGPMLKAQSLRKVFRMCIPASARAPFKRIEALTVTQAAPMEMSLRVELQEYYAKDMEELKELTGLETSSWLNQS